jgi:hypothetical protein
MVEELKKEELKKILDILNENNKSVWLFASLKMDEFVDKWSLVFSAPWINELNKSEEFKNIIDILKKNIADDKLSSIARIVFLPKTDHLVEELLKKATGYEFKEEKVNGNIIHCGVIIESNAGLQWVENKNLKLDINGKP